MISVTALSKATVVAELQYRLKYGGVRWRYYNEPNSRELYPKHWEFFDAGAVYKQRFFRAANRVGKTIAGGVENTYHLTGLYPPGWRGLRRTGPLNLWACSITSDMVKRRIQKLMLGEVGDFGTGLIPKDCIDFDSLKDAKKQETPIGSVRIKHVSGAYSTLSFKSYQQGWLAFQSDEASVWLDELPEPDVYAECLKRTMTGNNYLMITGTPLEGPIGTTKLFMVGNKIDAGDVGNGKFVTTCTWDDVPHLSEQDKADILASLPEYQREAASKGIPVLGAGAIFTAQPEQYTIEDFEIPAHWPRVCGIDVSQGSPGNARFAAVWVAFDPVAKVYYTYADYFTKEHNATLQANAVKERGDVVCFVDTFSKTIRDDDGKYVFDQYKATGLEIYNADKRLWASNIWLNKALKDGQMKVFRTCFKLLPQILNYQTDKNGDVIAVDNDMVDAWRYAAFSHDKHYSKWRREGQDRKKDDEIDLSLFSRGGSSLV